MSTLDLADSPVETSLMWWRAFCCGWGSVMVWASVSSEGHQASTSDQDHTQSLVRSPHRHREAIFTTDLISPDRLESESIINGIMVWFTTYCSYIMTLSENYSFN